MEPTVENKFDFSEYIVQSLSDLVTKHNTTWKKGVTLNNNEYFSSDLAKELLVRDQVRNEVMIEVDDKLVQNLGIIRALNSNAKKGKKKKNGRRKKDKSSKGCKTKGTSNKEKPLPGSKIVELKKMDTIQMLSILIEQRLINTPDDIKMKDLVGLDCGNEIDAFNDEVCQFQKAIFCTNLFEIDNHPIPCHSQKNRKAFH